MAHFEENVAEITFKDFNHKWIWLRKVAVIWVLLQIYLVVCHQTNIGNDFS